MLLCARVQQWRPKESVLPAAEQRLLVTDLRVNQGPFTVGLSLGETGAMRYVEGLQLVLRVVPLSNRELPEGLTRLSNMRGSRQVSGLSLSITLVIQVVTIPTV